MAYGTTVEAQREQLKFGELFLSSLYCQYNDVHHAQRGLGHVCLQLCTPRFTPQELCRTGTITPTSQMRKVGLREATVTAMAAWGWHVTASLTTVPSTLLSEEIKLQKAEESGFCQKLRGYIGMVAEWGS